MSSFASMPGKKTDAEPVRTMESLRVVFDTNVLLSLWVFADSRFAPLRALVDSGKWMALRDQPCLAEFKRVLGYPEFRLDESRQAAIFDDYTGIAQQIMDLPPFRVPLPRCSDADDQKFLELARDGRAHWLVTADRALLKLARRKELTGMFRIVAPNAALAALS